MDANRATALIEEALRGDLERCEGAIRAGDREGALAAMEQAFAKLDTALDIVRSLPRSAS